MTTTFRGTSTRGFASAADPTVAVCLLPGTELAFADNVRYDNRWIWTRTVNSRVGKFGKIDPHIPDRHHVGAIELWHNDADTSHEMRLVDGYYGTADMTPSILMRRVIAPQAIRTMIHFTMRPAEFARCHGRHYPLLTTCTSNQTRPPLSGALQSRRSRMQSTNRCVGHSSLRS